MGSSPTGSPIDTPYILMSNFQNSYPIDLGFFVFERGQNYLQNDTKISTIGIVLPE